MGWWEVREEKNSRKREQKEGKVCLGENIVRMAEEREKKLWGNKKKGVSLEDSEVEHLLDD